MKKFKAILEQHPGMDATFISIPLDVEKEFGTRGQVKVAAIFDGVPYRGILANMGGGCHTLLVRKDIRKAINKSAGDVLTVTLQADNEPRIVDIPADLAAALQKNRKAGKFFEKLSYTNRKEYAAWVASAKKAETRRNRLVATIGKLNKGFKNPSDKC